MLYPSLSFKNSRYLLDTYLATAAYSLRQLKAGVTSVVRVRRDSDNTESDFNPTEITDGTMATWIGANNGFVTTWYDQSGNGNNAAQATASNQPKIYDSVTGLITENGKPALQMDNGELFLPSTAQTANDSIFAVFAQDSTLGYQLIVNRDPATGPAVYILDGELLIYWNVNIFSGLFANVNDQNLGFWKVGIPNVSFGLNGGARVDVAHTQAILQNWVRLSGLAGSQWLVGRMQEVIIYNTDQSSNRATIESNINSHYSIY